MNSREAEVFEQDRERERKLRDEAVRKPRLGKREYILETIIIGTVDE